MKTEHISEDDVEIINSSDDINTENPKITRIKADEEFQYEGGTADNPMMKMMGNIEEIKKIKVYFFLSFIFGIWSLLGWREVTGFLAIIFGVMDLTLGSKLTQKAAYIGIIMGLLGLMIHFQIF